MSSTMNQETKMLVHIVYAHPTHDSFTGQILDAFVHGLDEAGHRHTISDLYAMGFDPVLDLAQYERESHYVAETPVPQDVADEQAKLNAADVWVFLYPVWWTDCPAILKGWFDRVWSVGFAYDLGHVECNCEAGITCTPSLRVAKKALIMCTAGHTIAQLKESGCYQAMETTMLTDRIFNRAERKEFIVFDGSADLSAQAWEARRRQHVESAYRLGLELAS